MFTNVMWISCFIQQVRLDVWHFMRRLARGCSSESHPLYGTFMGSLSSCLFEWDQGDFDDLMSAKRAELVQAGVSDPSPSALRKAISREELAHHCRRKTRGSSDTINLIEALLLAMSPATDSLGAQLFNDEMQEIWAEQKRHVDCLQDPPDVSLYTVTGSVTKGGVTLPIYRCARGTTSLESFHLHLARLFICLLIIKPQEMILLYVLLALFLDPPRVTFITKCTLWRESRGGIRRVP